MQPIQKLITEGKTEEAIKLLVESVPAHQKQEAITLQASFREVKRSERLGFISFQEAAREKAKINFAILDLAPKEDATDIKNTDASDRGSLINKAPVSDKQKILFIAANPDGEQRIKTDVEFRKLIHELKLGRSRDKFELLPIQLAVTTSDLIRAFNDKPEIVHFSGHGSKEGLIITTDDNRAKVIPLEALKLLFKPLEGIIHIAIFNACWSSEQAKAISEFGAFVVGNRLPINDEMAICFSKGFYNGLGEGKDFKGAFNDAKIMVLIDFKDSYEKAKRDLGFQTGIDAKEVDIIEVWKDGVKLDL